MIKPNFKTQVYDALMERSEFAAKLFDRTFHHPSRTQEPPVALLINDLNQYWRIQLGSLNVDTINARSALIDTDDFPKWLSWFKQYVLPTAVDSWVIANGGNR